MKNGILSYTPANTIIKLTQTQLEQINGGGFFGSLLSGIESVGETIGDGVAGAAEDAASGVTSVASDVGIPGAADATDTLQDDASNNFDDANQDIHDAGDDFVDVGDDIASTAEDAAVDIEGASEDAASFIKDHSTEFELGAAIAGVTALDLLTDGAVTEVDAELILELAGTEAITEGEAGTIAAEVTEEGLGGGEGVGGGEVTGGGEPDEGGGEPGEQIEGEGEEPPDVIEGEPDGTEGVPDGTEGVPDVIEGEPDGTEGVPDVIEGEPDGTEGVPDETEGDPDNGGETEVPGPDGDGLVPIGGLGGGFPSANLFLTLTVSPIILGVVGATVVPRLVPSPGDDPDPTPSTGGDPDPAPSTGGDPDPSTSSPDINTDLAAFKAAIPDILANEITGSQPSSQADAVANEFVLFKGLPGDNQTEITNAVLGQLNNITADDFNNLSTDDKVSIAVVLAANEQSPDELLVNVPTVDPTDSQQNFDNALTVLQAATGDTFTSQLQSFEQSTQSDQAAEIDQANQFFLQNDTSLVTADRDTLIAAEVAIVGQFATSDKAVIQAITQDNISSAIQNNISTDSQFANKEAEAALLFTAISAEPSTDTSNPNALQDQIKQTISEKLATLSSTDEFEAMPVGDRAVIAAGINVWGLTPTVSQSGTLDQDFSTIVDMTNALDDSDVSDQIDDLTDRPIETINAVTQDAANHFSDLASVRSFQGHDDSGDILGIAGDQVLGDLIVKAVVDGLDADAIQEQENADTGETDLNFLGLQLVSR